MAERSEARVGAVGAPPSRAGRARAGEAHHVTAQTVALNEDLPRQQVFPSRERVGPMFPSPAPLNRQELALIHLVKRDPEEVRMIAQEQEADRQRLAKMFEESGIPRK